MAEGKGKFASEVEPQFMKCRVMGHSYDERTSVVQREAFGRLEWSIQCGCGVRRTQVISREGFILRTTYAYPNGYVLKGKILYKEDRADLRIRYITAGRGK